MRKEYGHALAALESYYPTGWEKLVAPDVYKRQTYVLY